MFCVDGKSCFFCCFRERSDGARPYSGGRRPPPSIRVKNPAYPCVKGSQAGEVSDFVNLGGTAGYACPMVGIGIFYFIMNDE